MLTVIHELEPSGVEREWFTRMFVVTIET
jgi:hypothetical protein